MKHPHYGSSMSDQRFNIGDVVKYISKDDFWDYGETHIIAEVERLQGEWQYATNQGAWFYNDDFELVRRADKRSLRVVDRHMDDEEEDDDE